MLTYGLITALVYNDIEGTVITVLAITAKVVSNVGWFIMWVQCVELFPTTIRVTGSNFCALVANICTTPAPYVILLVNLIHYGPLMLLYPKAPKVTKRV